MSHWAKTFFEKVLPTFVTEGTLDFSNGGGVIYLPFCYHCIKEVAAAEQILSKYFQISFLHKSDLREHALWSATKTIDPETMQSWFGKAIDQEETYCTISPQEVKSAAEPDNIAKADLIKVLRGIEDFDDVRMIKLATLKKFDPECRGRSLRTLGIEIGGFVGLKKPSEVKNGFDSIGKPPPHPS